MTDKHIPASKLLALKDYWDERMGCMTVRSDDLRALIDAEPESVEHPRYISPNDILPSDVRVAGGSVGKGCKFETLMTRIEAFNKYYDENLVDKSLQVQMRKSLLKSVEIVSASPPADNLIAEKQATIDRLTEQRDRLLQALGQTAKAVIGYSDYWYDKGDIDKANKYNEMLGRHQKLIAEIEARK